jgi:hypothetical protein
MSYHDLSECTLTPDERSAEAGRIMEMLEGYEEEFRPNEKSMMAQVESTGNCSVKQLFWLRDIKDRIL